MYQIDLNNNELSILKKMVEDRISDLKVEINVSDDPGYKAILRQRKDVLEKVSRILGGNGKKNRLGN